jgi:hypothetical protein
LQRLQCDGFGECRDNRLLPLTPTCSLLRRSKPSDTLQRAEILDAFSQQARARQVIEVNTLQFRFAVAACLMQPFQRRVIQFVQVRPQATERLQGSPLPWVFVR